MTPGEALEFLRPAVDPTCRVWADLGAGSGTFTVALATLVDEGATIYAVDNDPAAVRNLRQLELPRAGVKIVALRGDVGELGSIPELRDARLDAVLLGNVLHYFAHPEVVLTDVATRLRPGGSVVLIEYDRTAANQWVPHPIPRKRVEALARASGFTWEGVLAERPSQYQGTMYIGLLSR